MHVRRHFIRLTERLDKFYEKYESVTVVENLLNVLRRILNLIQINSILNLIFDFNLFFYGTR